MKLLSFLALSLLGALPTAVHAAAEVKLPRVIVTGTASATGAAPGQYYGYPASPLGMMAVGTLRSFDSLQEDMVAAMEDEMIAGNITKDVRCNPANSSETQSTTSRSDEMARYEAAWKHFNNIKAATGLLNLLRPIPASPFTGGKSGRMGFDVIYADGGREMWMVELNYQTSTKSLDERPMPGSLKPGSGVPEPAVCTA